MQRFPFEKTLLLKKVLRRLIVLKKPSSHSLWF